MQESIISSELISRTSENKLILKPISDEDKNDEWVYYTVEEFTELMQCGACIPGWDGAGCYAYKNEQSNIYIEENDNLLESGFSHIVWYNK